MRDRKPITVLVTGGARRIGRAICLAFARAGARVIVHYNRSGLEAGLLLEELSAVAPGPRHASVQADLLDPQARGRLIPDLAAAGKQPTCLVNNASTYRRNFLRNLTETELRQDYEINFIAPFFLMQDFARVCLTGNIINLLDQRVATVEPAAGAYALAKKSLRDATLAAAAEFAPLVRVNAVAPGIVLPPEGVDPAKTLRLARKTVPMRRPSTPEEVAAACVYLNAATTVTGQIIFVDGGQHLAPLME